jgi:hypothetical protein
MNIALEFRLTRVGEILRPAILSKQIRRDDIYAFIRALGGEYRRDEQLKRVCVIKCAVRSWIGLF